MNFANIGMSCQDYGLFIVPEVQSRLYRLIPNKTFDAFKRSHMVEHLNGLKYECLGQALGSRGNGPAQVRPTCYPIFVLVLRKNI